MSHGLMNSRTTLVAEAAGGLAAASGPLVRVSADPLFVTRFDPARDKVALVFGGGFFAAADQRSAR